MISEVYYYRHELNTQWTKNVRVPRQVNLEKDSITLHIADMHGEYQLRTTELRGHHSTARVSVIIDAHRLREFMGEDVTEIYLSSMPQKLQGVFGSSEVDVWELWGSYTQLLAVFDDFCDEIFKPAYEVMGMTITTPSGDDDTYDYWPTAMTVAWQLACDLDEVHVAGNIRET